MNATQFIQGFNKNLTMSLRSITRAVIFAYVSAFEEEGTDAEIVLSKSLKTGQIYVDTIFWGGFRFSSPEVEEKQENYVIKVRKLEDYKVLITSPAGVTSDGFARRRRTHVFDANTGTDLFMRIYKKHLEHFLAEKWDVLTL